MLNMASQFAPAGWFTGSTLDTQHRVPLPTVTDQGPKWGQTKPSGGGITRNHVMGEGGYLWHLTWLISRTQVSRFSEPLPGDCCQGNRVRGKSGSLQDSGGWGGGDGVTDLAISNESSRTAFMSLSQSQFIHKAKATLSHYWLALIFSCNYTIDPVVRLCCRHAVNS